MHRTPIHWISIVLDSEQKPSVPQHIVDSLKFHAQRGSVSAHICTHHRLTQVLLWWITQELSLEIISGKFMAQIHTLRSFLFPRCLWVRGRKSSRRSERWCMVWTLCVSKGQGSEEVLRADDWPGPAVSPGWTLYCLDVAGSDQHSHSGALRQAEIDS